MQVTAGNAGMMVETPTGFGEFRNVRGVLADESASQADNIDDDGALHPY